MNVYNVSRCCKTVLVNSAGSKREVELPIEYIYMHRRVYIFVSVCLYVV